MPKPKWSLLLTDEEYKGLQECQCKETPTLSGLRIDLEYQRRVGRVCWNCRTAGLRLGIITNETETKGNQNESITQR